MLPSCPCNFMHRSGFTVPIQEAGLALSLVFLLRIYVCVCIFCPRIFFFCWSCSMSTCPSFGYWLQEIFPWLPQMPCTLEFAGSMRTCTVFNCDLIFPDLCKHFCIFSILIWAQSAAALIYAKGLGFSPYPCLWEGSMSTLENMSRTALPVWSVQCGDKNGRIL